MDILLSSLILFFSSTKVVSVSTQYENINQTIYREFKNEAPTAQGVFFCESGLKARAVSKTGDYGVSQINLSAHRNKVPGETDQQKIDWLFNFQNNLKLAKYIYDTSGFYPWVCAKKLGII